MWDVIKKIKYALFYSLYLPREGLGCEEERRKEGNGLSSEGNGLSSEGM